MQWLGNEFDGLSHVFKVHGTFATAGSDGAFNFWDKDSKQRLKVFSCCICTFSWIYCLDLCRISNSVVLSFSTNVRPCQGAISQFLAVRSTMMARYMHMRYVVIYITCLVSLYILYLYNTP